MLNDFMKSPVALIVGVPILFLLVVALVGFVPQFFVQPKYDFVYIDPSSPDYYMREERVSVSSGRLLVGSSTEAGSVEVRFRRFNTDTWESMPISVEVAQALSYDPSFIAPDGYEVSHVERGGGGVSRFFFVGSSYSNGSIIKKGVVSRPLPITLLPRYYGGSQFVGWVIE
ncbi:hypothetical protein KGO06_02130 [Patescibacteria group bacterium]|nr:hypothetical protein [Patescibacteria group bacterium]